MLTLEMGCQHNQIIDGTTAERVWEGVYIVEV